MPVVTLRVTILCRAACSIVKPCVQKPISGVTFVSPCNSPNKSVLMNITITEVHPSEIPHTVDFVMRARAGIFPLLDTVTVPPDLAGFEQVYLDGI